MVRSRNPYEWRPRDAIGTGAANESSVAIVPGLG